MSHDRELPACSKLPLGSGFAIEATMSQPNQNSPRIMQSIFTPAARRETRRGRANLDRRDGELKMLCIMFSYLPPLEKEPIMPTRNVNLTNELDRFVLEKVESGRYENASEVVRAARRAWGGEEREKGGR